MERETGLPGADKLTLLLVPSGWLWHSASRRSLNVASGEPPAEVPAVCEAVVGALQRRPLLLRPQLRLQPLDAQPHPRALGAGAGAHARPHGDGG